MGLNCRSAENGLITGASLPHSPGHCHSHDMQLLSLLTVGGCVLAEGSGRSGREGLALLRTAISREWLVLIALISRAEAKPAVHRPRLAPGAPGKEEQRETLLWELGTVGDWELGGPETGGAKPGWLTPLRPEPMFRLQSSQHSF